MSWAEVKKINNNMKIPLNEQIRNNQFQGSYVFSGDLDKTFKPDKTGYYKIIVVGAGGQHKTSSTSSYTYYATGGSGGVAIKNMRLISTQEYNIKISYGTSIFNEQLQATPGGDGRSGSSGKGGEGGTASGGDFNYDGINGIAGYYSGSSSGATYNARGADVGVFILGLMKSLSVTRVDESTYASEGVVSTTAESGQGILGLGCSGGASSYKGIGASTGPGAAGIIIIPLELEE